MQNSQIKTILPCPWFNIKLRLNRFSGFKREEVPNRKTGGQTALLLYLFIVLVRVN